MKNMQDDLIYDVGMHNGDDTAYYLTKGYRVVGIDANPELCAACENRFADAIAEGNLTILNVGVGIEPGSAEFFINDRESQISSFAPNLEQRHEWRSITRPITPLSSIMLEHGVPYFAKIDVEHFDHLVLRDLLAHQIRPELISAEAHSTETFDALQAMGYGSYALTEGYKVPEMYRAHAIRLRNGDQRIYAFEPFSSGPFGEDLIGEWLPPNAFEAELNRVGLGWIDIHARI
jgi:FkbM family methyltransferase